jgi:hypothetical protein
MKAGGILLLTIVGVLVACKKDKTMPVDIGYAYFPTTIGQWVEYQVDSSWYDEANLISGNKSFRLREEIFENFTDPEGRAAQRIRRSVLDSVGNWHTRDIWWQTRDNFAAEKTEENLRRLKLSFPVGANRYWNMNAYNTAQEVDVTYQQIHTAWSDQGLSYDSTVVVKSTYFNNLIDTLIFEERYAKNVGMISQRWIDSNTQYPGGFPETKGWRMTMTAVAYGE